MKPRGDSDPPQTTCPLPTSPSPDAGETPQKRHKKRSKRHQRVMTRKALLEQQRVLKPPRRGDTLPPDTVEPRTGHGQARPGPSGGAAPDHPLPCKYVAIDCEMVGTGPGGRMSELARCSVVNYHGDVLYDKYIQPERPIVQYRTRWSGITRWHMRGATPFQEARKEILKLLRGKVVVGHALHNDFRVLKYFHPHHHTRDTSSSPLLVHRAGFHTQGRPSLKNLSLQLLNKKIQMGKHGHSSVEDATTAMELYQLVQAEWERDLATSSPVALEDGDLDPEHYLEDQYWPEDLNESYK
ncbi:apoptosis-enhancing nuclease [Tachyglossus aculeatus]|uniref:apoptosis-enhancing nuclease n=1 Tax=Tachyglossus aculeatus TaxID=9261 RepID=UPI0018F5DDC5|nr:apoptosis-enhancing nuclease [Tachyglossus aculeatus]XP_038603440.1 apoptosis-enhancing nuclease [Tachyglossus aculeatus]XP_038603441.1 apoptosis-enhancing nuclease [Tachyglossus aculeatus]XP_038603442.1 apoptosis-enhancing nuclease [Tachyglossus aculeatus]